MDVKRRGCGRFRRPRGAVAGRVRAASRQQLVPRREHHLPGLALGPQSLGERRDEAHRRERRHVQHPPHRWPAPRLLWATFRHLGQPRRPGPTPGTLRQGSRSCQTGLPDQVAQLPVLRLQGLLCGLSPTRTAGTAVWRRCFSATSMASSCCRRASTALSRCASTSANHGGEAGQQRGVKDIGFGALATAGEVPDGAGVPPAAATVSGGEGCSRPPVVQHDAGSGSVGRPGRRSRLSLGSTQTTGPVAVAASGSRSSRTLATWRRTGPMGAGILETGRRPIKHRP